MRSAGLNAKGKEVEKAQTFIFHFTLKMLLKDTSQEEFKLRINTGCPIKFSLKVSLQTAVVPLA